MTADLAVANAGCVLTVPQALLDAEPKVVRIIKQAERDAAARGEAEPGPYRVHRMPIWNPIVWKDEATFRPGRRLRRLGARHDPAEVRADARHRVHHDARRGRDLRLRVVLRRLLPPPPGPRHGAAAGRRAEADGSWSSRGGRSTCGTRATSSSPPTRTAGPTRTGATPRSSATPSRSTRTPRPSRAPAAPTASAAGCEREDFQVLRNRAAFPRAWVVHKGRFLAPIVGLGRAERDAPMQEILYSADPLWYEQGRTVFDPREIAWLDKGKEAELAAYLPGNAPQPSEMPRITRYEPQRVELDVDLQRPGLVILADIFYPGWTPDDRRPTGADLPRQPDDARRGGPRGRAPPGLHLPPALVPHRPRPERGGPGGPGGARRDIRGPDGIEDSPRRHKGRHKDKTLPLRRPLCLRGESSLHPSRVLD